MNQKDAYKNILDTVLTYNYGEQHIYVFTFEWLQDINWHIEAKYFYDLVTLNDEEYKTALKQLKDSGCDYKTFNNIFNFGLMNDSWESTSGKSFVDEILNIIFKSFKEINENRDIYYNSLN